MVTRLRGQTHDPRPRAPTPLQLLCLVSPASEDRGEELSPPSAPTCTLSAGSSRGGDGPYQGGGSENTWANLSGDTLVFMAEKGFRPGPQDCLCDVRSMYLDVRAGYTVE